MILLPVFTLFLLLAQPDASLDNATETEWEHFKSTYGKSYAGIEEMKRRSIWEQNWKEIMQHNANLGAHAFRMGTNEYSDMTVDEFIGKKDDFISNLDDFENSIDAAVLFNSDTSDTWIPPSEGSIPDTVDWKKSGWVTSIKNQGTCGACWAFSAVGALESQHMNKTGQLLELSEQNLVDCSTENSGCDGGDTVLAFDYVKKNKGIDKEISYPYTGLNGVCKFNESSIGTSCTGYMSIEDGNEDALKAAVALVGPISVIIDACHNSFFQYKSGIFDEPDCRTDIPSHAMLIIGYGTEDDKDYWLLKNSFGTTWGLDGYIKMSRNKNNQCGIASRASFPLV